MSKKWPGGIITPTPATPSGPYDTSTAPGIWTLSQQAYWQKQGLWPTAGNTASYGIFAGGLTSVPLSTISSTVISSTGTFTAFGTLITARYSSYGVGSSTRGIVASGGGTYPTLYSSIEYMTIASTGTTASFGNVVTSEVIGASLASATRGVFCGGYNYTGQVDATGPMQYITIASTGNSTSFGTMQTPARNLAGTSNSTYGIMLGGFDGSLLDTIQYITIATTGNSASWGTLSTAATGFPGGAVASSTRGVFASAQLTPQMAYITFATSGSATTFGDIPMSANQVAGFSNKIYGIFGSATDPQQVITIATTGNSTNYGSLSSNARSYMAGFSNNGGNI